MSVQVLIKSSAGLQTVSLDALELLETRTLYVIDKIDKATADDFVRSMRYLNRMDKNKPINIYFNSPGGELCGCGLRMYDEMKLSSAKIRTICDGDACSMAGVLYASGDERYIYPHARVMLHEPALVSGAGGSISSLKSTYDNFYKMRKELNNILMASTGRTEKEIEEAISYDHYFSAEECIKFGLADKIVTRGMNLEV